MIARVWRGFTKAEDGDAYEGILRKEILPSIHKVKGCTGSYLLRRNVPGEAEFVTMLFFESYDAVSAFAGAEYETAVIAPIDQKYLTHFDRRSTHYEVVLQPALK